MNTRHEFGHFVASAPGVESRSIWQVITGSLSAEPEPTTPTYTKTVSFFFPSFFRFFVHICSLLRTASEVPQQSSKARQPQYNSHAFKLCPLRQPPPLPLGVYVFGSVRACVYAIAGSYSRRNQEHRSLMKRGAAKLFSVSFLLLVYALFAAVCVYHTVTL